MGQLASRPADEDPLAKKRREIKERGVLIPPSFGVVSVAASNNGPDNKNAGDDDVPLSSDLRHVQSRLSNQLIPSLLSDLSVRDLSNRILDDYMQAGFWLSTSTSSSSLESNDNAEGDPTIPSSSTTSVKAGFQVSDDSALSDRRGGLGNAWSNSSTSLMSNGLVSLQHSSSHDGRFRARACVGTDNAAAPCATLAYHLIPPATSSNQLVVMGHGSVLGTGWVGAHLNVASFGNRSTQLGNVQIGSWAAGSLAAHKGVQGKMFPILPENSQSSSSTTTTALSRLGSAVDTVGAYAAADFLRSTAAFQVQCRLPAANAGPSTSMPQLHTRSYFSINLADEHRSKDASGVPPPPPLVVTLERSGGSDGGHYYGGNLSSEEVVSSLSVSQVLHLDRYQVNPLEDRAPKIRNTLGWTIRLERVAALAGSGRFLSHDEAYSSTTDAADNVTAATTTRLAVGGAWQINRAVAVKAVANPDAFTAALILRRWKEPRVTCSLLFRNQMSPDGFGSSSSSSSTWRPRFVGVGLQVETGDQLYNGGTYHYADQRKVPFDGTGVSSPETKATLPQ